MGLGLFGGNTEAQQLPQDDIVARNEPPTSGSVNYPQENYGQGFYGQQNINQASADVLNVRLNTEDILEKIEHDLKGEFYDGTIWQEKYGRWVNDEGLAIIVSIVAGYVNKINFLGNLSQEQINFKCRELKKEVAKLVFSKYERYDIDVNKRTLLVRYVVDKVHMSLSRSEGALESRQISQTSQQSHIIHEQKNLDNGGLLSKIPFIGRN